MQNIKDILNLIQEHLNEKDKIYLVNSQRSTSEIKFESLNYKTRRYFIFRLETENERYKSREEVKNILKVNKKKFTETYAQSTEPVLDIKEGLNGKTVRIVFKNSKKVVNELKNKWYNDLIKKSYSNIGDITPNDKNELEVLRDINQKITQPINLKIENKTYKNVIGLIGVKGNKKADFVVVDKNKKELCWISYKKGSGGRDFQQYSGMSKRYSKDIHEHPEVEEFRKNVVQNWEQLSEGRKYAVYKKIEDNKLKKQSVFGKDYGRRHGENNVTYFVQGDPRISIRNDVLVLDFGTKLVKNGRLNQLRREYEPVMGARGGEGNRVIEYNDDKLRGVRGGIFAEDYVKARRSKEI